MNVVHIDNTADLFIHLKWHSDQVKHTDGFHAAGVNFWRDMLPNKILKQLLGKQTGDQLEIFFPAGEMLAPFDHSKRFEIKREQFQPKSLGKNQFGPEQGRFYPKGILAGVPNIFRANRTPFRCGNINNGHIEVDFNHPLAETDLQLSLIVGNVMGKTTERGGRSIDWIDELTRGPGMQARWRKMETDFFSGNPFARSDEDPDSFFYRRPRPVHHIDDVAIEIITNTYGRILHDGMRVLDLMSSWQTYIPDKLVLQELVGLGLNREELMANRRLSEYRVHDLNQKTLLPFENDHFDAVICNVSVEYLTDPFGVFEQVARVLSPGGYFVVTFSNRWFPPKVIRIWQELLEFERVGLVLEYFIRNGMFGELQTYSVRGLPRPVNDKYFPKMQFADPVFAVWGRKKG